MKEPFGLRVNDSSVCGIRPPSGANTSGGASGAAVQHFKRCKNGAALQAVQHFKRFSTSSGASCASIFFNTGGARGAKCKRCKAVQSAALQAVQHFKRCKNGAAVQHFQRYKRCFDFFNTEGAGGVRWNFFLATDKF